jgi:hypothetical protein
MTLSTQNGREPNNRVFSDTWVDWIVISTNGTEEQWRGTIIQEKQSNAWLIVSMKEMQCIDGCYSASNGTVNKANEDSTIQTAVRAYYSALSTNNLEIARSIWKTPPKSLYRQDVPYEYAILNKVDDPIIIGNKGSVWVDIKIKKIGSESETWKGKVWLEKSESSTWLITSLSNMSRR